MSVGSLPAAMFAAWAVELSKLAETETGQRSWHNWAFLRTAYLDGDPSCGGSLVACASAAAKSLSAAVSALGTGSRHWEVETIFRNEG